VFGIISDERPVTLARILGVCARGWLLRPVSRRYEIATHLAWRGNRPYKSDFERSWGRLSVSSSVWIGPARRPWYSVIWGTNVGGRVEMGGKLKHGRLLFSASTVSTWRQRLLAVPTNPGCFRGFRLVPLYQLANGFRLRLVFEICVGTVLGSRKGHACNRANSWHSSKAIVEGRHVSDFPNGP